MSKQTAALSSTPHLLGTKPLWGHKGFKHGLTCKDAMIKVSGGCANTPRTCRTPMRPENDLSQSTCVVDACNAAIVARGRCTKHYQQFRKSGQWTPAPSLRTQVGPCSVDGCDTPMRTRGLCASHYSRTRRGLAPDELGPLKKKRQRTACSEPGCAEPHNSSGFCQHHYMADYRARTAAAAPCAVQDCHRPVTTRGWCASHYQRWSKYGIPTAGGPQRRDRGTGYPHAWYSEQRRRKIGWPTAETLEYVKILRGDPCSYCGRPWEHTDHIQPVAKGGTGDWTNLTAACASCNYRKLTSDLLTFMLRRLEVA